MQTTKLLHTKKELATALGVSPRTIDYWTQARVIPVIRTSKRLYRYRVDAVMAALERHERKAIA